MSERDRLTEIIKAEAKKYPPGYDLDEGCRHVADAMLASEEWQAREAVVKAANSWAHWGDVKTLHVLSCPECERLESVEDRWCVEAAAFGRKTLDAAKALRAALVRLAATRGEEKGNG